VSEITTVGVDLAKKVIVAVTADGVGHELSSRQFSFEGFGEWAANLPPCTIGMEACSSSHYWGRRLSGYGHTVRLIAPDFVRPFRKSRRMKNDRNDAQAVLAAMRQPGMRFVTVKSVEQQGLLAWHRMRAGYQADRTALINRSRGILAEFGVWLGLWPKALMRALESVQGDERIPARLWPLLAEAKEQLRALEGCIERCEAQIRAHAQQNEDAQRISDIVGVGPITASAVVAAVSGARDFKNGRQLSAWIGLVPSQHSSGGQARLGPITKRGNSYLRRLLVEGACSAMRAAQRRVPEKRSRIEQWMIELAQRVGYKKATVGLANKHARMIWAILAKGESYDPEAWKRFKRAA